VEEVSYRIEQHEFIVEKLMADDLMKLVQSLPDGYRVVFNMFAIEGYSHQEIAKEMLKSMVENQLTPKYNQLVLL
jgi:RNA polymerase sigma-70 factor (ECF subfamily)